MMNRTYDREWYKAKVDRIYEVIPDCAISTDTISGFCSETEEEHMDTLSMIEYAKYTMMYSFFYSERPGTLAAKKYEDDIPLETKKRRLQEIIDLQGRVALEINQKDVGKEFTVLVEGTSKKSDKEMKGRNSQNKMIIFPRKGEVNAGDYVKVIVTDATRASLRGRMV